MVVWNESESVGLESRFRAATLMDQQGRPNELQLVYRRDPEMGTAGGRPSALGLIPHFCEKRPEFAPIHARAETIAHNEWFSDAYRKRRCVVPMNNFFQKDGAGKRYVISRGDGDPFGVAGIWENWNEPVSRQWIRTFAIITVPANDIVATIHDRMPAILDKENFPRWFGDEADPRDLLTPFPGNALKVLAALTDQQVAQRPSRKVWEHSIPAVEARHYSITFRTMAAGS